MLRQGLVCAAVMGSAFGGIAAGDVVTDWNEVLLDAIRTDRTSPPAASRAMAMVHIAVYDAVNGIAQTHEPYYVDQAAPDGASAEAAAAAAAHATLVALFPAQQDMLDAALDASLAAVADGAAEDNGVAWGQTVAAAILALRSNDGSADIVDYTPGTAPGDWQATPPAFGASLLPQWPEVTPFAMTSGSQFRGNGPPPLESAAYADACNDVLEIGNAISTTRTADQTEIATFWVNGPGTATPPGHWNSIAQLVATQRGNSLEENARLFALLNIAQADAAIVSWDSKYQYNHWRPVTAIRMGDLDGNDATIVDPEWTSFIPTPPFPEYTSGHSTFSGAASKVLERFFGRDDIAFSTSSDGLPGVERAYAGFAEAADESGISRIYGGIHFQYSNADGLSSGRALGDYVYDTLLQEVDDGSGAGGRLCGALGLGNFAAMAGLLLAVRLGPRRRRGS